MRIAETPQHAMKRGDNAPAIRYQIPLLETDLSGASVALHIVDGDGNAVALAGSAAVESVGGKIIRFDFLNGDTALVLATPPPWRCEFEVAFSNGDVRTFPTRGSIELVVRPDLG